MLFFRAHTPTRDLYTCHTRDAVVAVGLAVHTTDGIVLHGAGNVLAGRLFFLRQRGRSCDKREAGADEMQCDQCSAHWFDLLMAACN